MARTQIPVTTLTANGILNAPATTAADQANGMYVDLLSTSTPVANFADRLFFIVSNSAGTTPQIIVRKGLGQGIASASGPGLVGAAFRAALGDLTLSVTALVAMALVGPVEWARFATLAPNGVDPAINVDFSSGFTGTIIAAVIPRSYPTP